MDLFKRGNSEPKIQSSGKRARTHLSKEVAIVEDPHIFRAIPDRAFQDKFSSI
jgi:hypothetical protein